MKSSAYTSPLHLDPEASKSFGLTTLIAALCLVIYVLSIPQVRYVRVVLPTILPVDPARGKVFTTVELGQQERQASERTEALRKAKPGVMQVMVPPDVPMDVGTKAGGSGGEWGTIDPGGSGMGTADGSRFTVPAVFGDDTDSVRSIESDFVEIAEIEPGVDLNELQRSIHYPPIALRNGIQGSVMIKALIGTDGAVRRVEVVKSDNDLLNEAALNGVRNASFTPGIQNGHAVSCWIYVPVNFRLQ